MVVIKLRLLRWEIISACPDGTKVITRILTSRRKERESQRESEMGRADGSRVREMSEDGPLLTLKTERQATSQGLWATSRTWRSQENRFLPRASRKTQSCQHCDLNPGRFLVDLWPLEM